MRKQLSFDKQDFVLLLLRQDSNSKESCHLFTFAVLCIIMASICHTKGNTYFQFQRKLVDTKLLCIKFVKEKIHVMTSKTNNIIIVRSLLEMVLLNNLLNKNKFKL